MTRALLRALSLLSLLLAPLGAAGCGKYGPPVRTVQPAPRATAPAPAPAPPAAPAPGDFDQGDDEGALAP